MNFASIVRAFRGGFAFVRGLHENVEAIQKTWQLASYPKRVDEKRERQKRKLENLSCKEKDVSQKLELLESQSSKRRKREVDDWLGHVHEVRSQGQELEQQMSDRAYSLNPLFETKIDKIAAEVDELLQQSSSFEETDLLLDEQPKGGESLTRKLVLPDLNEGPFKRIWDCLMNEGVQRIGVYGVEGVGKTEIMRHVNNKLIEGQVINVVWVTVAFKMNVSELQDEIARQVGINLSCDEDTRRRASRLQSHWRKRKTALFLDGLSGSFEEVDIGNISEIIGCKLIIGAREKRTCAKMKCKEYIEVDRLPEREAEILFREELSEGSLLAPAAEVYARLVAQQCRGVPRRIISMAESMRGVDDPREWRDALNELQGNL